MNKLSEQLQQASDCGDFGRALEEYPEMARELERERDELRAHCRRLRSGILKVSIRARNLCEKELSVPELIELERLVFSTPAQSLAEIKAQAIEKAVKDCMPGPPSPPDDPPLGYNEYCEALACVQESANQLRKEAE